MKISCVIIEDEPLAKEKLKNYVQRLPQLDLLGCFDSAIAGLGFLKANKVELLFLDIRMDEFSGIQLLESTKIESEVVLTTAYDAYALKGYELNVTDYLLKPFTFERFVQSVDKVQNKLSEKETLHEKKFIFIKTEYRLEKVFLNEILFIEGMRDYRRVHTLTKKIMTLQTFKELEQEIPSNIISRVHKSYMVALDKIESIERDRIKIKDLFIPISDTYKKVFMELIKK